MQKVQNIEQNEKQSRLEQVTENLELLVTKFLTVNERATLSCVCKRFQNIDLAPIMHCNLLDQTYPYLDMDEFWRPKWRDYQPRSFDDISDLLNKLQYVTEIHLSAGSFSVSNEEDEEWIEFDEDTFMQFLIADVCKYIEQVVVWDFEKSMRIGFNPSTRINSRYPAYGAIDKRSFRQIREDHTGHHALRSLVYMLRFKPETEYLLEFPELEHIRLPQDQSNETIESMKVFQELPKLRSLVLFLDGGDSRLTYEQIEALPLERLNVFALSNLMRMYPTNTEGWSRKQIMMLRCGMLPATENPFYKLLISRLKSINHLEFKMIGSCKFPSADKLREDLESLHGLENTLVIVDRNF